MQNVKWYSDFQISILLTVPSEILNKKEWITRYSEQLHASLFLVWNYILLYDFVHRQILSILLYVLMLLQVQFWYRNSGLNNLGRGTLNKAAYLISSLKIFSFLILDIGSQHLLGVCLTIWTYFSFWYKKATHGFVQKYSRKDAEPCRFFFRT